MVTTEGPPPQNRSQILDSMTDDLLSTTDYRVATTEYAAIIAVV